MFNKQKPETKLVECGDCNIEIEPVQGWLGGPQYCKSCREKRSARRREKWESLNLFVAVGKCTKCGCTQASTKYKEDTWEQLHVLKRICSLCNHQWRERPLDSIEDTVKETQ